VWALRAATHPVGFQNAAMAPEAMKTSHAVILSSGAGVGGV